MYFVEESTCDVVGAFGAPSDLAFGAFCPLAPRYAPSSRTIVAEISLFGGEVTQHSGMYKIYSCALCCETSHHELFTKILSLSLVLEIHSEESRPLVRIRTKIVRETEASTCTPFLPVKSIHQHGLPADANEYPHRSLNRLCWLTARVEELPSTAQLQWQSPDA